MARSKLSMLAVVLALVAILEVTSAQRWRGQEQEQQWWQRPPQRKPQRPPQQIPPQQRPPQRKPPQEKPRLTFQERLQKLQEEQLMMERQQEQEELLQEEMDDLIANYELEEVATQLGTDTLSRILRGLRQQPTVSPLADCVTREFPVELKFTSGTISYQACGAGASASIKVGFRLPGETTTPFFETTTPFWTTTSETTTAPSTTTSTTSSTSTMSTTSTTSPTSTMSTTSPTSTMSTTSTTSSTTLDPRCPFLPAANAEETANGEATTPEIEPTKPTEPTEATEAAA